MQNIIKIVDAQNYFNKFYRTSQNIAKSNQSVEIIKLWMLTCYKFWTDLSKRKNAYFDISFIHLLIDTYFTFYGSYGLQLFYNFSSTIGFIMLH